MAVMTEPRLLPAERPLTIADLDHTPDNGQRYELDDGVLVVSAAPMAIHQRVLYRLEFLLELACPPEFELLPGPGVEISEIQYRIPDLAVIRAGSVPLADSNVKRPPVIVVEIASPSTARYDRNRKKAVYAEFGIPAYWIVDPDPERPSITEYRLTDAAYREAVTATGPDPFVADFPFPVQIVPAGLVAGPWRR
jgi:Uma2 family endonuclease